MVGYCILTGLVVYYLALWIWYRHADNHTPTDKANNAPLPQSQVSDYTLIGESRYKGGLIGTTADKSGHLPKAAENDTIFAPQVDEQPKESTSAIMPDHSGIRNCTPYLSLWERWLSEAKTESHCSRKSSS